MKKKFVQVGLGGRHEMFRDAVMDTFKETSEMLALCDNNEGRLKLSINRTKERYGIELPGYNASDFEKMITDHKPDFVIVTTTDHAHDKYICSAMEMGCDVVTEKPMTIDEKKCQRIMDTQKKTGKEVRVTFNYRYSPARTQVKELIMNDTIGDILSVDFKWMLDTTHGADYYRRWHRYKKNSGGMMVHKSTHHFDLVNWWIDSIPKRVFASGHRKYYTAKTADLLGLSKKQDRCLGCHEAKRCNFFLDLKANPNLNDLYLSCEKFDGYHRDMCVFSDDFDIEDNMNVIVDFENDVKLSYSLNTFCPWEGYVISFNGTKGRIEHSLRETVYINADGRVPGELDKNGTWTKVFPLFGDEYDIEVWEASGGHGGGDDLLLSDIFGETAKDDKYKRAANHIGGAYSIITGIAANISMNTGKAVDINKLLRI